MTTRQLLEEAGVIWTRRERRRLARAGAGRGRRRAVEVPCGRAWLNAPAFTSESIRYVALMAVPGLRPCDVHVTSPEPARVRVELDVPQDAMIDALFDVEAALEPHVPLGVALDVSVHGWPQERDEAP